VDIIILAKFLGDRLMDVDSVGVENGGFPLTKPLAVNTLLTQLHTAQRVKYLHNIALDMYRFSGTMQQYNK